MASLFFPQLSSGAMVQYPLRKTRHVRTIINTLADGSMLTAADPYNARLQWELVYQDLTSADRDLLQTHFANCGGPWQPFVFIDPTDNMLSDSGNLASTKWLLGANVSVAAGVADPFGGNNAFLVTNTGQTTQQISQTLTVPAGYRYCFSVYAAAASEAGIELIRSADSQQAMNFSIGTVWNRLVSSGQLNSALKSFTAAISLAAGQQISLYGPQLEPQLAPSSYRATIGAGGVYPNAHWALNNLTISAASPSLFNTSCVIETNL